MDHCEVGHGSVETYWQHFQIGVLIPGPGWNRTGTGATDFTPSRNQTKPNTQFLGRLHIFATSELGLQLSICVEIVPQYDIYINDAVFDALPSPILLFAIQSLFVGSFRKLPSSARYFTATQ